MATKCYSATFDIEVISIANLSCDTGIVGPVGDVAYERLVAKLNPAVDLQLKLVAVLVERTDEETLLVVRTPPTHEWLGVRLHEACFL